MEHECFTIVLRGPAPVILCPARSIDNLRIRPEWREPLRSGRLLIVSAFTEGQRRATEELARSRNRLVAALSEVIFIPHASPSSRTFRFCQEVLGWKKPLFTFDNPANAELIAMGVRGIALSDVPSCFVRELAAGQT
jgi:hypothetical protein